MFDINKPNKDLDLSKTHGILFDPEKANIYKTNKYMQKKYNIYVDKLRKLWADHVIGSEDINLEDVEKCIMSDNKFVYYYHIILDESDVKHGIYANNILCESFRYSDLMNKDFNEIPTFNNF